MTKFDLMQVDTIGNAIAHSAGPHRAPRAQWIRSFSELIGWSGDFPSILIFSLSGLDLSMWLVTQTWLPWPDELVGTLLP